MPSPLPVQPGNPVGLQRRGRDHRGKILHIEIRGGQGGIEGRGIAVRGRGLQIGELRLKIGQRVGIGAELAAPRSDGRCLLRFCSAVIWF